MSQMGCSNLFYHPSINVPSETSIDMSFEGMTLYLSWFV